MPDSKKRVLYFYSFLSPFVKKDIEILSSGFEVGEFDFYKTQKQSILLAFTVQKLFLLWNIWACDLVVCQFAGYLSFLPALYARIFSKPCVIISGGTDAVSFPSIRYGNFYKKLLGIFTTWSYRLCTHIAPKHKTLMWCDYDYEPDDFPHQGILFHCKGLKKPFTEITNGYDAVKWHCTQPIKRENTFITVSGGWEYAFQYKLKGIDLMVEAARMFPDCTFIIVGMPDEKLVPQKPANLQIIPPTPNEKLMDIYSGCEFYMQLSMAEGFPNSICEAMLCECIPIGSGVFSIPEIIGEGGFVLKHKNAGELRELIASALNSDKNTLRKKARQRIAENYTLEMRKEKLLKLCNSLMV